jgi:hypothetical protein
MRTAGWLSILLLHWCLAAIAGAADYSRNIAALIAPEKLATLRSRGANPRIQKAVAQLEAARASGLKVEKVAADAVALAGYRSSAAKLTAEALVRNYDIAAKLGCLRCSWPSRDAAREITHGPERPLQGAGAER